LWSARRCANNSVAIERDAPAGASGTRALSWVVS
jgi:hypothetical protein